MLLAGDIGGTKSNLAVFKSDSIVPVVQKKYINSEYKNFPEILHSFLSEMNVSVKYSCLAVAGPIFDDSVTLTNLNWQINSEKIRDEFKLHGVKLINDLEALCVYTPYLQPSELITLHPRAINNKHNIAVIGLGTGLGEAFLTWNNYHYCINVSEGGHSDFAPKNNQEIELLHYLLNKLTYVCIEDVCSAIGIVNIFNYLHEQLNFTIPKQFGKELEQSKDKSKVIIENAINSSPLDISKRTIELLVSILGSEIGNLSLKILPFSGIYIGGGIPARIISYLQSNIFLKAFLHKGRIRHILDKIPIYVILNSEAGLLGAAKSGIKEFKIQ